MRRHQHDDEALLDKLGDDDRHADKLLHDSNLRLDVIDGLDAALAARLAALAAGTAQPPDVEHMAE